MPIHVPTYTPPSTIDPIEKFELHLKHEEAALKYAIAYNETIGVFAAFSRKKAKALKEARENYKLAVRAYLDFKDKY